MQAGGGTSIMSGMDFAFKTIRDRKIANKRIFPAIDFKPELIVDACATKTPVRQVFFYQLQLLINRYSFKFV